MTGPLHEGDQGGQLGASEATLVDVRGHGGLVASLTTAAPVLGAGVLLDGQGRTVDVNLLHDSGEMGVGIHRAATAGASVEVVFLEVGDLLGRERLPLVHGVAGLPADEAFVSAGIWGRFGFDDVRGRGFGRGGGILASAGQLLAQLDDLGLQSVYLRLQPLAAGTWGSVHLFHTRDSMSGVTARLGAIEQFRPACAHNTLLFTSVTPRTVTTFPAKTSAGIRPPAAPPLSGLGAPWLAALRSGRALCTRHPTPLAGLGHRSGWVSCCTPVTPAP